MVNFKVHSSGVGYHKEANFIQRVRDQDTTASKNFYAYGGCPYQTFRLSDSSTNVSQPTFDNSSKQIIANVFALIQEGKEEE
jgi:hypothetical protein